MFKKSLKAILTGIFVFSMLSTNMMCSAVETTTAITTTSISNVDTSKVYTSSNTNVTTSMVETNTTTTIANATTTTITTNSNTTTNSANETTMTTTTPIITTTTTTPTTTTASTTTTTIIESTTSVTTAVTSYMGQDTEYITKEIDDILYDNTLTSEEKNNSINTYLKNKILSREVPVNVALEIMRNVKSAITTQENNKNSHKNVNNSLNSYLQSLTLENSVSIEKYCSNLIKTSFKQGIFTANETIKLLKDLQNKISEKISELTKQKENAKEYEDYKFNNSNNVVNQLSYSYSDLKGWIYIPNANIDYPIMHYYDDNDYYLQHDINGFDSSQGCIELDYRCDFDDVVDNPDYTSNRLIYGHNLYNGLMFSNLARYKDPNYWAENKLIEISTLEDQQLYEIYACCSIYGMGDGTQFNYWNAKYINMDYDLFQEYMYLTQETMLYETGNFPTFGQDIITLQTCDGDDGWRIVIFAKRVK